ncbi:MAG: nucleotidyltransferase domain-containing protein [Candidatus Omnitrophica bacterium]|nr:nucleotidyltransferase domain-containing protein [Candidatus Omnitrophota bacterium]MBU1657196.1 nucleotidyltransferase domain-containing protein [Candidatus Omnitrophota bacterium]
MKITKPLDKILDRAAKIKVLRFLCGTDAEWNGRQIAKVIEVTPATAHKALNSLNNEGVLLLRNMGKTHVYSLNYDNFMVSDILKPLFEKERKILDNIIGIIKKRALRSSSRADIISVALFGSVNIRQDHAMSDIDIAVVVKNAGSKTGVERLFEEIDREISKKFGNTLSAYVNTMAEFKTKKKENKAVINNILKEHTLIYGDKLEAII